MCYGKKFKEQPTKAEESIANAMYLWSLYGERYRTLLEEYHNLLAKKRELGLPLKPIRQTELAEFPRIEFLYISDVDVAEKYLEGKTLREVHVICNRIKEMIETNYVYRTLVAKVNDYASEIRIHNAPKLRIMEITLKGQRTRCHRTSANN